MPKTALADTLEEGDSLVVALNENEDLDLPYLRELRDQLVSSLAAIRELYFEQAALQARRQALTQQLRITRRQTQDLVIKVRSAIRGKLGHRNELLVRYRVRPVRRRSRATDEEVGVRVFPRPDLLPAAGLAQTLPGAVPAPSPAAASSEAPVSEPVVSAPAPVTPEETTPSSGEI